MAASITISSDTVITPQGSAESRSKYGCSFRALVLSCTCHTDGSFSVELGDATSGLTNGKITGWRFEHVVAAPGSTAPTDASDITIKTSAPAIDILDGNGTDLIDSATVTGTNGQLNSVAYTWPITDTLTIAVTNNEVASATFTLRIVLSR